MKRKNENENKNENKKIKIKDEGFESKTSYDILMENVEKSEKVLELKRKIQNKKLEGIYIYFY
jgi:hypothetical protein